MGGWVGGWVGERVGASQCVTYIEEYMNSVGWPSLPPNYYLKKNEGRAGGTMRHRQTSGSVDRAGGYLHLLTLSARTPDALEPGLVSLAYS